jgi:hypothetical protein
VTANTDVSVMAQLWRIRIRSWMFALVRRIADLPFWFADVRRVRLDDFPKLSTTTWASRTLGPERKLTQTAGSWRVSLERDGDSP